MKASIRARTGSSRRAYNGLGGSFGMQLIPVKKHSLKSAFCVCTNNWTCHFCTGQRVNLVSSFGTRCPTAQVRAFKDIHDPQLQLLRAVSPDRCISRTNKYLPFKCDSFLGWVQPHSLIFYMSCRQNGGHEPSSQFEEVND